MVYLSLLGILLAVVLFMFLSFRGIPVTVCAATLIFLVWLFSLGCPDALSFDEVVSVFGAGVNNIVSKYLLMFMFSALFGSIITYTGIASALGRAYERLVSRAPQKLQKLLAVAFVPFLNAIFVYSGINVFVAVFAVVAVAKDLFKRMDIPWRLYSLSMVGSATFAAISMPGSASITNLAPIPYTGTTPAPVPVFSIIITVELLILGVLYMQFAIKRSERRQEGFFPSGAEIDKTSVYKEDQDKAPVFLPLAIPLMFLPVILMNLVGLSIVMSLLITDIVVLLVYQRRVTRGQLRDMIVSGLTTGIGPTMTLGLMTGFVYVLIKAPGFQPVFDLIFRLPIPDFMKIPVMIGSVGFLLGNYNATVPAAMEIFGHDFLVNCGVNMGVVHRLTTFSSLMSISPHNSGLCNSLSVAKLSHRQTYFNYFMIGPVLSVILLISSWILIGLGITY